MGATHMGAGLPELFDRAARDMGLVISDREFREAWHSLEEPELDPQIHRNGHSNGTAAAERWRARLASAVERFGVGVTPIRGTLDEIGSLVRTETPAIARVPHGPDGDRYILILRARPGKFHVVDTREAWLSRAELARRLRLREADAPVDWALLRPLAPCGIAKASRVLDPHASDHELHGHGHGDGHGHGHDHDDHHHAHLPPHRRLFALARPDMTDIAVIVLYAICIGILSLAAPLTVEAMVSTVAMTLLHQQLAVLSLILLVCLLMAAAFDVMQTYMAEILQRRAFARVSADLAYRLPRVRLEIFEKESGTDLVNRFFDVLTLQKSGAFLLLDGVGLIMATIVGMIVLAFYHPFLLGYDLLLLAALTITLTVLGRGAVRTSISESYAKYDVAQQLEELAGKPYAFRFFGARRRALERVDLATRRYLEARRAHFKILLRQIVFAMTFQAIALTILLGLGGYLVIAEQITLGQLVASEMIVATIIVAFTKLGKHLESWYDLMAGVDKLGHLFDLPLERIDGEHPRALDRATHAADVRLHDVCLKHRSGALALQNIRLHLPPGARVAIFGLTGSGKSSLGCLLFGLKEHDSGRIELDGLPLRELSLDTIRHRVGLATDLPDLIEDTILENMRIGNSDATLDEIQRALETVDLWDMVCSLPKGLSTRLGIKGFPLSAGQGRRLGVARALLAKPGLLVIDEALDGLPPDSREAVVDRLLGSDDPHSPTILLLTSDWKLAGACPRRYILEERRLRPDVSVTDMRGHLGELDE